MKINMKEFTGKCSCGREHTLAVEQIYLEAGALDRISDILSGSSFAVYHNFIMICDENTYKAAGERVEQKIKALRRIVLGSQNLHADEKGVAKVKETLDTMADVDCLIAVGSGTIHDLTRYCAYERKLPFISIPTAASVDGYVSTVAAMSWYGFKRSMIAVSPILVIADSQVIADAPMRLTASGVGDLLGKYTALADWKITNLLNGEYICDKICCMEYDALESLNKSLEGLASGNIEAYEELMYGLLLSGLAMQMTGHSRPASGAEHHLAHFWEMAVINKELDAYHGEKVGVGLLLVSGIYHKAAEYLRTGDFTVKEHVEIETDLIERTFQNRELCDNIKKTNTPNLLDAIHPGKLKEKTEEIVKLIEEIPDAEEIRRMLDIVQGVTSLSDIGLEVQMKEKSARVAPYIRDRLTFLRILKYYDFYDKVIK